MLRPLDPPSVDVFPAAAEAKLEVNGEGIIVGFEAVFRGPGDLRLQHNRQVLLIEGLAKKLEGPVVLGKCLSSGGTSL